MKARLILSAFIVAAGALVAFLPSKTNSSKELDAEEIMREMKTESNMESVDDLASKIINKDPTLIIIDVRSNEEYTKFTLPGALNIPLDSILSESWIGILEDDLGAYHKVFISNGTSKASEAWMLCRRKGYKNNYVLKGGLNEWFSLIIHPNPPKSTNDKVEMANYQRRLGFKQFFTGGKVSSKPANSGTPTFTVKKKKGPSGGCG